MAEAKSVSALMASKNKDQPPTPAQAATPPPVDQYRKSIDQDWAISMLMELQKTVGQQESTLKHVDADVTEMKKTVGRMEKVIYAATAIFVIGGGVLGWMINAAKELYIATHSTEQQHYSAPQASPVLPPAAEIHPPQPDQTNSALPR